MTHHAHRPTILSAAACLLAVSFAVAVATDDVAPAPEAQQSKATAAAPSGMSQRADETPETITHPVRRAQPEPVAEPSKPDGAAEVIKAFDHIVVDRKARTVTVDGFICLDEGPLELFACGNHVREHEAVVSTLARPREVNVALVLLDLQPGHPAVWTKDGKFLPPYGPVFRVFVEWEANGKTRRVEAHEMLIDAFADKPAKPQKWVFCGGLTHEGHFVPDFEGTVVCLSNFAAPILDVPFESTDKNTQLMFMANKDAIPTPGTKVKLVLQATGETIEGRKLQWALAIEADGSMTLDGEDVTPEQLDERLKNRDEFLLRVLVFADPQAPAGRLLDVMSAVTKYGLDIQVNAKATLDAPTDTGNASGADQ